MKLSRDEVKKLVEMDGYSMEEREALRSHLRTVLEEAGGELTADVLAEADFLFDGPGTCIQIMCDTLVIYASELGAKLARRRTIACQDCGTPFTVVERRQRGGYKLSKETRCLPCRSRHRDQVLAEGRLAREREAMLEKAKWQHERQLHLRKAQIDQELLAAEHPFRLEVLRLHLRTFVEYWLTDPKILKYTMRYHLRVQWGAGCMVCGQSPLHLLVPRAKQIPVESPIWYFLIEPIIDVYHEYGEHYQMAWPNLDTYAQVLWRLSPAQYFEIMPIFPFRHIPLLLLCLGCVDRFADSHTEVFV